MGGVLCCDQFGVFVYMFVGLTLSQPDALCVLFHLYCVVCNMAYCIHSAISTAISPLCVVTWAKVTHVSHVCMSFLMDGPMNIPLLHAGWLACYARAQS